MAGLKVILAHSRFDHLKKQCLALKIEPLDQSQRNFGFSKQRKVKRAMQWKNICGDRNGKNTLSG